MSPDYIPSVFDFASSPVKRKKEKKHGRFHRRKSMKQSRQEAGSRNVIVEALLELGTLSSRSKSTQQMFDFPVSVVLPAGGCGQRLACSLPKQYHLVKGKPLLCHSVEAFEQIPWVNSIIVAADDVERVGELFLQFGYQKTRVVKGEPTRHRSIKSGLLALQGDEPKPQVVIIHDAVRPLVPYDTVTQVVTAANQHGASGAIRPLVSTVIASTSDGFLDHTLDRTKYRASEMPQAFQYDTILKAYDKCSDYDLDYGTECLHLADKYSGVKAKLVEGNEDLWKVTYKKDLYAAEGYLKELFHSVCIISPEDNSIVSALEQKLKSRFRKVEKFLFCSKEIQSFSVPKYSFNNCIFYHLHEIEPDKELEFEAVFDSKSSGTVVHIIDHKQICSYNGMGNTSVYSMHENGLKMTKQYEKLNKTVTYIHSFIGSDQIRIAEIVSSLILQETNAFSGQTLFV